MDESRTDKTLDALAELYLTPPHSPSNTPPRTPPRTPSRTPPLSRKKSKQSPMASTPPIPPGSPNHPSAKTDAANAVDARDARNAIDAMDARDAMSALDGPQPIRLRPKPTRVPPGSTHRSGQNPTPRTAQPDGPNLRLHPAPEMEQPTGPNSQTMNPTAHSGHTAQSRYPVAAQTSQRTSATDTETALPTTSPIQVEMVLLGNLPGFGGPWLTQYAHQLAVQDPEHRPVVVLRFDHDQVQMDLVQSFHDRHDHEQRDSLDLLEQLEEATEGDGPSTAMLGTLDVLTRPDEPWASTHILVAASSLPRQDLLQIAASLQRWTLLTGADETALAAAGQLLSQLTDAVAHEPHLSVVVMGSQTNDAQDMARRLGQQIERPVQLVGVQPRMEPVSSRDVTTQPNPMAIWPDIAPFLNELAAPPPTSSPTSSPTQDRDAADSPQAPTQATPARPDVAPQTIETPTTPATHTIESESAAEPVAEPVTASFDESADQTAYDTDWVNELETELETETEIKTETQTTNPPPAMATASRDNTRQPQPKPTATSATPSGFDAKPTEINLVDYLQLNESTVASHTGSRVGGSVGGNVALDVRLRCPRHPEVQLAVDPDGRIRLLRYETDEAAIASTLIELIETRAWVVEHAQLLAMSQRQIQFDTTQPPALHLFTPAAKRAAAMVHQLTDVIHVHLLVPITVGEHQTWYSAALS